MAFDWSSLIPSAAPIQDADLDPDKVRASGDPMGMIAAAKAGVPYQAKPGQMGRTLTADGPQPQSSPIGAVQRTGVSSPPNGGAVTTNDAPGDPSGPQAVPSTVTPSGSQSAFSRSPQVQSMVGSQQKILQQAANLPAAPDVAALQARKSAAVAGAPDPTADQYKPSGKSRFLRGLEGVGLGLAEGGLRGAIAGGIAPQTTGLAGYRDPNSRFNRDNTQSQRQVADLDQQITGAQQAAKDRSQSIKDDTELGKAFGDSVTQDAAQTTANAKAIDAGKAPKLPEGEMPLGQTGPQLQKSLQDRYQVLNPGKPLPAEYNLPPNATQKDYDRIDKALAGVESATGTKNQRDQANSMREAAMAQARMFHEEAMSRMQDHANDADQRKGKGLLDKAEGTYRTGKQSADELEGMIDGAESGNRAMAAAVPLEGALAVNTSQGVKRINRTEVDQFAGAGSLYDKIVGEIGKLTAGQPIPKNILEDQRKLAKMMRGGAYENYKGAYDSATKRYGLDDEKPLPDPRESKSAAKSGGFNWDDHPKVKP